MLLGCLFVFAFGFLALQQYTVHTFKKEEEEESVHVLYIYTRTQPEQCSASLIGTPACQTDRKRWN